MFVEVPAGLRAGLVREGQSAGRWLDRLPDLAAEFLDRWRLRADGRSMHGVCALVLPVRATDGEPAALKLSWPHPEARDEHLALDFWAGDGAVRLLDAAPRDYVVLLGDRPQAAGRRRRVRSGSIAVEPLGRGGLVGRPRRPPALARRRRRRACRRDRQLVAGWVVVREAVEALDAVVTGDPGWRDVSVAIGEAFAARLA